MESVLKSRGPRTFERSLVLTSTPVYNHSSEFNGIPNRYWTLAATPLGAPNLCPTSVNASTPSAKTSTSILPDTKRSRASRRMSARREREKARARARSLSLSLSLDDATTTTTADDDLEDDLARAWDALDVLDKQTRGDSPTACAASVCASLRRVAEIRERARHCFPHPRTNEDSPRDDDET